MESVLMREANPKALKRKLGSDSFVEDELRRTETTEAKGRRCKVVLAHVRALEGLAGDSGGEQAGGGPVLPSGCWRQQGSVDASLGARALAEMGALRAG